jgi:tartrate-resistant acid phosphatase type 5
MALARAPEGCSVVPVGATPLIEALEPRQFLAVTNGLNAVYFNNRNFTGAARTRIDPTVAFDWPNYAKPARGIRGTTFSARWHGLVKPYTSEEYTFVTRNNDGVRLWVNGELLIDSWEPSKRATHSGSITLKKNRLYDLRLEYFSGTRTAAINLFWSSPSRGQTHVAPHRLFAYDTRSANIGDFGRDNEEEADVAALLRTWKPDYITTTGDNNYPDGEASTIDDNVGKYFHDFIGNYPGDYGPGADDNLFFPALGNHDWETDGAQPHLDYFTLPGNERYYDFRRGSIHYFVLDSDEHEPDGVTADSEQADWLRNALDDSDAPFKLVVVHHAPYSSGAQQSTQYMQWPFPEWGADLVLAGHSHLYERLSVDGFTYVVNGAGSENLGFLPDDLLDESVVIETKDVGALLVQANEYALTLQYQLRSGEVIDTVTIGA